MEEIYTTSIPCQIVIKYKAKCKMGLEETFDATITQINMGKNELPYKIKVKYNNKTITLSPNFTDGYMWSNTRVGVVEVWVDENVDIIPISKY
jgi:hypothetical protein